MQVRFRNNREDQLAQKVVIPSWVMAKLVDYFIFNTDKRPYFDGDGQLEGIEGVPKEIFYLVESVLEVSEEEKDYEVVISYTRKGRTEDTVEREVRDLIEEKLGRADCVVTAKEARWIEE